MLCLDWLIFAILNHNMNLLTFLLIIAGACPIWMERTCTCTLANNRVHLLFYRSLVLSVLPSAFHRLEYTYDPCPGKFDLFARVTGYLGLGGQKSFPFRYWIASLVRKSYIHTCWYWASFPGRLFTIHMAKYLNQYPYKTEPSEGTMPPFLCSRPRPFRPCPPAAAANRTPRSLLGAHKWTSSSRSAAAGATTERLKNHWSIRGSGTNKILHFQASERLFHWGITKMYSPQSLLPTSLACLSRIKFQWYAWDDFKGANWL